jgi:hypothetical protein
VRTTLLRKHISIMGASKEEFLVEAFSAMHPPECFLTDSCKDRRRRDVSTPSTTIIANLKNLTSPTGNTVKAANTAGIDMTGMILLAQTKALELKACLALLAHATDGSDGNLATLNNILASLV